MSKISVLTSVYNGEKTVKASIESLLFQTFKDFELIVVDDGSRDASFKILSQIADPRIKLLQNEKNLGLSKSLNRAFTQANGKYIARHDGDDISYPQRFERQVEFLEAHAETGVLGGQMDVVDLKGRRLSHYTLPVSHGLLAWNLFFDRSFAHPTIMMRRELLENAGGYDEDFRVSQDHQLWTRLVLSTRFANLPEALVGYRPGENVASRLKTREQFANRLRSRQRLASGLLKSEIPNPHIRWMEESQKATCNLTGDKKIIVANLVFRLYGAYKESGILFPEDQAEVYPDFLERFLSVGKCQPDNSRIRTALKMSGLRWAITHPLDAAKKTLGIKRHTLAGTRAQVNPTPAKDPLGLSVVVVTHEREESLSALLRDLRDQNLGGVRIELIIFNNSSAVPLQPLPYERLGKLIHAFKDNKVMNSSYNWGTAARYAMAALATHETMLFLDDDLQIEDKDFVAEMFETFQTLEGLDILSSWNELWIEWGEDKLKTVSLDFLTPGIESVIPTDTIGPGIAMFRRRVIQNQIVMDAAMQRNQEHPIVSDMSFPLAASMVHGANSYYFPAWKKLSFHDQAHQGAIYKIANRQEELLSSYKEFYKSGYRPVLSRVSALSDSLANGVVWAAQTLPSKEYRW